MGIAPTVVVKQDLLDTKTGLRTEPAQFCEDVSREAPPLFTGEAPPPPTGPHADVDLAQGDGVKPSCFCAAIFSPWKVHGCAHFKNIVSDPKGAHFWGTAHTC